MTYQYVPARTNHVLHFILCGVTLGLWFPVYCLVVLHNHGRMVAKRLPSASAPAVPVPPGLSGDSGYAPPAPEYGSYQGPTPGGPFFERR